MKDSTGEPIIGATVRVDGTEGGTITDFDGNFTLSNVKKGDVLVITYLGFEPYQVKWNGHPLDIVMKADSHSLEELVVVGYGVQKKSSLTGSVASVSSKDIVKQTSSNVASTLQGRTPGVEIIQQAGVAGADVNIVIRGAASFGATEPLYIIDGAFSNNGLTTLNPNDIESIEILKDGAAAAIYGSRAANVVWLSSLPSAVSRASRSLSSTVRLLYRHQPMYQTSSTHRSGASLPIPWQTIPALPMHQRTIIQPIRIQIPTGLTSGCSLHQCGTSTPQSQEVVRILPSQPAWVISTRRV